MKNSSRQALGGNESSQEYFGYASDRLISDMDFICRLIKEFKTCFIWLEHAELSVADEKQVVNAILELIERNRRKRVVMLRYVLEYLVVCHELFAMIKILC